MGKRKKRNGEILTPIEIASSGAEGQCIARTDGKVVFVEKAVPGDVATLRIIQDRSGWMKATIVELLEKSADRVDTFCQHFPVCGGCKWQQMGYAAQLRYKNQQVRDALKHIGKVEVGEWLPIAAASETKHYRNKLEFTFSNKGYLEIFDKENPEHLSVQALGYHAPGRFDKVFDVDTCYLMPPLANDIRNGLRSLCVENAISFFDLKEQTGMMRNLLLRCNRQGEWLVVVVFAKDEPETITLVMDWMKESFPQIVSLHYVVNEKRNDTLHGLETICVNGEPFLIEVLGDLTFRIQPKSFFQTNTQQAEKLYSITKEFAELSGTELVYDLYSGTGTIGLFLADKCSKVVGVEYVQDAVDDAYENAQLNGIRHASFFAGDMAKVLDETFVQTHGKPDVVITDPPRAGMHPDVVARLLQMEADKIVYVSCNPATQARDLHLLSEKYYVLKVQPIDMFPHTHHVESVALLGRRGREDGSGEMGAGSRYVKN